MEKEIEEFLFWNPDNSDKKVKLECELNGKRHYYDKCCSNKDLEQLKSDPNLIKIGEGYITYINDVKNVRTTLEHFFVRKDGFKTAEKAWLKETGYINAAEFWLNLKTVIEAVSTKKEANDE